MPQFLLGLSDRQAAEAMRCHIDFKDALAMELDDPVFRHSVLSDVRKRLTEGIALIPEVGLEIGGTTTGRSTPAPVHGYLDSSTSRLGAS